MASVANRETTWISHCAQPRFPSEMLCRELFDNQKIPPAPHIEALSNYLRISDHLIPKQANLNRFILRHPDLSPNNIFVNDSLEVVGVIDWQHSSVLPVFLHVGIPNDIQNFHDDDSLAMNEPRLPDNFAELGADEQETAREVLRRREVHSTYVGFTNIRNPDHSAALHTPYGLLRKRLFQKAGTAWQGDNVSLKADLIQVSRFWEQITSSEDGDVPECPLEFSEAEIKECLELAEKVQETMDHMERVRDQLGMNEMGCVLPEHYDEIKERCRVLKAQSLEAAETELEREEVLNHFPFDDHDESGNT
ncbi:MAG: hypothetical protein Q9221_003476 [Calogaya cf. arnoldii]